MIKTYCFLAALLCLLLAPSQAAVADYIWIESEEPVSANIAFDAGNWGVPKIVSGEVFSLVDPKSLEEAPGEHIEIAYTFQVDRAGRYHLWKHIGFERSRPDFEWRIDEGAWQRSLATDYTVDLKVPRDWNELAWLNLGETELQPGGHRLEIRIPKELTHEDGKPKTLRYVSDAFCLIKGSWRPDGGLKPDEMDRDFIPTSYTLEAGAPGQRSTIQLSGPWDYARYDEFGEISDRTGPAPYPTVDAHLHWEHIEVPADRNTVKPEDTHAHRFIYRTTVEVPQALADQSFSLDFTETGIFATVYVNGEQAAHNDIWATGWSADLSPFMRAGSNEILIIIKDNYYAVREKDGESPRALFNLPFDQAHRNQGFTMRYDRPVKGYERIGISDIVNLTATGPVRVTDTFVQTSVAEQTIKVAFDLSALRPSQAEVSARVVDLGSDATVKTLPTESVQVKAGSSASLSLASEWSDPELWWPDDPHLYELVTEVKLDGKIVDTHRTTFGFREWTVVGARFHLNGQPWKLITDCEQSYPDAEALAEAYADSGRSMFRLRFQSQSGRELFGMTQRELLESFDRLGLPVRRTAATLDGQHASYRPIKRKDGEIQPDKEFFDNWQRHMLARVKFERNHPSIFVWETDNEFVYINLRNFGFLEELEPAVHAGAQKVMDLDPTRKIMSGGGRAGLNSFFPVYGVHYEDVDPQKGLGHRDYPDEAYIHELTNVSTDSQPWPMEWDRPIFHSEVYFADGYKPQDHAAIGGEQAFLGRAGTFYGADKRGRMIIEGYRWRGVAATHLWLTGSTVGAQAKPVAETMYNSMDDLALLSRQWNWSWGEGEAVTRLLRQFNDTRHRQTILSEWTLELEGATVASDRREHVVAPGAAADWKVGLTVPEIEDGKRLTGHFVLTASVDGEEVFRAVHPVNVVPEAKTDFTGVRPGQIAVWDTQGAAKAYLNRQGIPFVEFASVDAVPAQAEVVLIGSDTLTPRQSGDPAWKTIVRSGKRVIVLDQEKTLHYHAVSADYDLSEYVGRIGHLESPAHPILNGVETIDLDTWNNDHVLYRNPLEKGTRGLLSLIQVDDHLGYSALGEVRLGEGTLILNQLAMGEKLSTNTTARRIFNNALHYALDYERADGEVALFAEDDSPLNDMFEQMSVAWEKGENLAATLRSANSDIVVLRATEANMQTLLENREAVDAFCERGGYLMISQVEPSTLDAFSRLVGIDHRMRPFHQEKVTLVDERPDLISGASLRDIALYSGERIVHYQSVEWLADDGYDYVLDLEEIAAFGVSEGDLNTVNGMTSTDFWKYIRYFPMEDGLDMELTFPKAYRINGYSLIPNDHYYGIKSVELTFDDGSVRRLDVLPEQVRQDFSFEHVESKTMKVTLIPTEEPVGRDRPTLGIDNMWVYADRGESFEDQVEPLANIGVLVKYPKGEGAIVVNQMVIRESEGNPINGEKKKGFYNILLANMGARFAEPRMIAPGEGLNYRTISLESYANAFLSSESGWHDSDDDLGSFPIGKRRYSGVDYDIRDFTTSPLESAVILNNRFPQSRDAPESVTVPIHAQLDALFFLHSFVPTNANRWEPRVNRKTGEVETRDAANYTVRYADGSQIKVPVQYGRDIHDWIGEGNATPMKGAYLAWSGPAKTEGKTLRVYQLQWSNPHPEKVVESVTLDYAKKANGRPDNWLGSPIVFGITAARAKN